MSLLLLDSRVDYWCFAGYLQVSTLVHPEEDSLWTSLALYSQNFLICYLIRLRSWESQWCCSLSDSLVWVSLLYQPVQKTSGFSSVRGMSSSCCFPLESGAPIVNPGGDTQNINLEKMYNLDFSFIHLLKFTKIFGGGGSWFHNAPLPMLVSCCIQGLCLLLEILENPTLLCSFCLLRS